MIDTEFTKTIDIQVAGTLKSLLVDGDRESLTNLKLTGFIDARDLFFIRDEMPKLCTLDIMSVTILSFEDNNPISNNNYSANEIPQNAFYDCRKLTNVTIPEGIISIGDSAFSWCTDLKNIKIPNSVTFIADNSFSYCYNLQSINVETTNTHYISSNGVLFNKDSTTLIHYPLRTQNESIIIPKGVTSIGNYAFTGCSKSNIILNDEIKSIGNYTFKDCKYLTNLILPKGLLSVGEFAFSGCKSLTGIDIPNNVISIKNNAFEGCENIKDISIGNVIKVIEINTFAYCTGLSNVNIPNNIIKIESSAFSNCSNLSSICIGSGLSDIDTEGFGYCEKLVEIFVHPDNPFYCSIDGVLFNKDKTKLIQYPLGKQETIYSIPNEVTAIGDCAFRNCETLTNILFPNRLLNIGVGSFSQCKNIDNIKIPNSVITIEKEAFNLCNRLNNLSIGSGVKFIGVNAFSFCKITNLIIPDNVINIGDNAFSSCSYLIEVNIGKGVEIIGIGILQSCNKLQFINLHAENNYFSIVNGVLFNKDQTKLIQYPGGKVGTYTIPSTVKIIASCAFSNCRELSNIIFSDELALIESYAFYYCSRICSVIIPNGVTTIGDYAFCCCKELVSLTLGSRVHSIGQSCFKFCSLEKIYTYNITPPTLDSDSFDGLDIDFITETNDDEFDEYDEENNVESNIEESDFIINVLVPNTEALNNYKTNESWKTFFPEIIIKIDESFMDNSQQRIIVNDNNKTVLDESIENEMKYFLNQLKRDTGINLVEKSIIENRKDESFNEESITFDNKPIIKVDDDKRLEHKVQILDNENNKKKQGCFISIAIIIALTVIISLI